MKRFLDYLRLGVIIGPLPNTIANGQAIDANPVMADLNWILAQVNANVPPLIPSSTAGGIVFVAAASVGGTANAITLAPTPVNTGYAVGQMYRFQATATNTGATTVNTSALGNRNVITPAGGALTGGEIVSGGIYDISDTGAAYQLTTATGGTLDNTAFTPAIAFGGAAVGVTYGTQTGIYFKIGPMVYFWLSLVLTSKGSSVGAATITGMPFKCSASVPGAGSIPSGAFQAANLTFGGGTLSVAMIPNTLTAQLVTSTSGAGAVSVLDNTGFSNTTNLFASGVYPT